MIENIQEFPGELNKKVEPGRRKSTSMLQKPRMPQIRGVEGEVVLGYCEPSTTKEMRHHTAFPKGKN
jgi:hypothetical protein